MAYEPHVWVDKEVITAEKLNNLEEGAKAKSIQAPREHRPQGEPGPKGDGFTGEPVTLGTLEDSADTATMIGKINEVIGILAARGVTKGE
ncbi:MAG: hypothetical protein ACLUKO_13845 [Enterocloster bolteae]